MTTPKSAKPETGRRRTQEERSATTREKVIQAAIDCIVEEGLHNTTAARIAARSGVPWGALAHQFGDKDSVFFAVVERNADIYQRHLAAAMEAAGASSAERVSALIDVTWSYINEPASYAFNELIIHNRASSNAKIVEQQDELSNKLMKSVWDRLFGTFVPEDDAVKPRYGIISNLGTFNPFRVAFHEWVGIWRDVTHAKKLSHVFGYVFGPPGWSPDGSRQTSEMLKAEWRAQRGGD